MTTKARVGFTGFVDTYKGDSLPTGILGTVPPRFACRVLEVRDTTLLVELQDGRTGEVEHLQFTPVYMYQD